MNAYALFIHMHKFHVHGMDRCENVRRSLDDAFARLGHCDRCARCQEDGLVSAAQRQVGQIVTLDENNLQPRELGHGHQGIRRTLSASPKTHLLITETHLTPCIPADIHAAQKHTTLTLQTGRRCAVMGGSVYAALLWWYAASQFRLDRTVVLLVDDVVDAIPMDEQILHGVAQILGRIVGDIEEFAVLCEHHQKTGQSLQTRCGDNAYN